MGNIFQGYPKINSCTFFIHSYTNLNFNKNVEISWNRTKGRPKKTKKALKVQMKTISQIHHGLQNQIQKVMSNDTLNDADNLENFENTCINTAIVTISATIASSS